jgi:hypothetical protein
VQSGGRDSNRQNTGTAMPTRRFKRITLAQLLVGGCAAMSSACFLVAHAQAQQHQVVPPLPPPASLPSPPVTNPAPSNTTVPQPSYQPIPPTTPSAVPGNEATSPVNEGLSRTAGRPHERTAVAKTIHHRGSINAGWIPPPYWDGYYFVGWQCWRPCGRRWLGWWGAQ